MRDARPYDRRRQVCIAVTIHQWRVDTSKVCAALARCPARAPGSALPPDERECRCRNQTQPPNRPGCKDNGSVEEHEGKKCVNPCVHPSWTTSIYRQPSPPPGGIYDPHGCEEVIEIQPASPTGAQQLRCSSRSVFIRRRMTPMVVEVKCAPDMGQVQQAGEAPCQPRGPVAASYPRNDRCSVQNGSSANDPKSEYLSVRHAPHRLQTSSVTIEYLAGDS